MLSRFPFYAHLVFGAQLGQVLVDAAVRAEGLVIPHQPLALPLKTEKDINGPIPCRWQKETHLVILPHKGWETARSRADRIMARVVKREKEKEKILFARVLGCSDARCLRLTAACLPFASRCDS
jgi:hypothetical protein